MATETQEKRDLPKLLTEMKEIQEKYDGQSMPKDVAETWQRLGAEAKALQDSEDRRKAVDALDRFSREIPEKTMPEGPEQKNGGNRTLGYTTPGHMLVESEEYKRFVASGQPRGQAGRIEVKDILSGRVKVTQAMLESKAVVIGEGVIFADTDPEIVRNEEQDRVTLRDVINVQNTGSNLIEYRRMTGYTRAARPVAEGTEKPRAGIAFARATAPVRTIAVWESVTEQQMQDAAQLVGILQGEMRYDLDLTLEEQMVWGDGEDENLLGIMETPGVEAGRTVQNDTLLDKIRRAMTDVQKDARRRANAALIDPIDLEDLHLQKGNDDHYLFQTYPTADGGLRVWGLRLVESIAGTSPEDGQRIVLVGDYARGATLWDRQMAAIAFGWIDDQFITNERTIRAELRAAFGVKRPQAFKFIETEAGGS